jgi:hypothetical protein
MAVYDRPYLARLAFLIEGFFLRGFFVSTPIAASITDRATERALLELFFIFFHIPIMPWP